MTKNQKSIALIAGVSLLAFLWLRREPPKDDYGFLMELPGLIAGFAEKKQASEIRKFISEDYSDSKNRTYQDLNGLIMYHVMRGGEVTIYTLNPEVELDQESQPPQATLKFLAGMAKGKRDAGALDVMPQSASVYEFNFELEKTSEGWMVLSGNWRRARLSQ